MQGTIAAVCTSPVGGIPKYHHVTAKVVERGLEGDYHSSPERWSFRRKILVPNYDRHLLLVSEEVKRLIFDTKKFEGNRINFLAPGGLSENILVRGVEDLDTLAAGTMLSIQGGKVLLRVIEPAKPCKHVRAAYGIAVYTALMGKRGIYCAVHAGVGAQISPSDPIEVIPGGEAATADPPPKDKPTADAAKVRTEYA